MKSFPISILLGAGVVFAGCGGGSGSNKGTGGSGGGTTGIATGGSNGGNSGSTSLGGSGGNDKSDGGPRDAVAAQTKGDAWAADAVQSGPKGDLVSDIGSCPAFTPCGGDLVGTWSVKSSCTSTSTSLPTCVVGVPVLDKSGLKQSYAFGSDGTVIVSASGTFSETIQYSASCLGGDAGAAQTCSS